MRENELSKIVFEAGLLEKVYEECLFYELHRSIDKFQYCIIQKWDKKSCQ